MGLEGKVLGGRHPSLAAVEVGALLVAVAAAHGHVDGGVVTLPGRRRLARGLGRRGVEDDLAVLNAEVVLGLAVIGEEVPPIRDHACRRHTLRLVERELVGVAEAGLLTRRAIRPDAGAALGRRLVVGEADEAPAIVHLHYVPVTLEPEPLAGPEVEAAGVPEGKVDVRLTVGLDEHGNPPQCTWVLALGNQLESA